MVKSRRNANLDCASTISEACHTEAIADEVSFSKALLSAFQISPKCKGTEFIVDSAVGSDPQDALLQKAVGPNGNQVFSTTSTQWEGFASFTYVLSGRLWEKRE